MQCVPSRDEFHRLAREANVIPVYREVIADIDTPVSALAKLGPGPSAFLLESVEGGERLGRYSFLGNSARMTFQATGSQVTIEHADGFVEEERSEDPLGRLEQLLDHFRPAEVPGLPRFFGGAVGYVGFDGLAPEGAPSRLRPAGEQNPPDIFFVVTDTMLIFDHVRRKIQVVANALAEGDPDGAYDDARARIDDIVAKLQGESRLKPLTLSPATGPAANGEARAAVHVPERTGKFQANVTPERFQEAVAEATAKVRSGDVFQVVLSLRLSAALAAEPFDLYRLLRTVNPSPYMFFLDFGDVQLVGSSPEVMVRLEDGEALLRPIAGTRRRGRTAAEDEALAKDLLADEKERAEHVMLVDLGRGDLGRVCRPGSVRVDEWMAVEKYSHVMHIVSNVRGELDSGRTAFDLLKASFPAGTVSGAPKGRALQIIGELEDAPRGPYGGAVGYFGFNGNMDSCIAIRTVVIHGGLAHVQAGAGIVADSDPEKEYIEIHDKARALLQTIALAEEASK